MSSTTVHHRGTARLASTRRAAPLTGMQTALPRPSSYVPPVVDKTHVCGPLECSTGSPLTCIKCGKVQPGSFVGTCLRGG